jgi:hypothetical protein
LFGFAFELLDGLVHRGQLLVFLAQLQFQRVLCLILSFSSDLCERPLNPHLDRQLKLAGGII